MTEKTLAGMTGAEIRALCRAGTFDRPTAGVAMSFAQVNLVILRAELARRFEEFCRLNPKPCPLLEVTPPGRYEPVRMAPGADVRTDLPRYRVFRHGVCVDKPTSIVSYWPDDPSASPLAKGAEGDQGESPKGGCDLVAFLIGCSFTFESALLEAGIPVRHIEEGRNVPMYRTSIACEPAGPFAGPLVVSMRPMTPAQAEAAARITSALPKVHGPPVHVGDPQAIGIADVDHPDYGDPVTVRPGEVAVFWACGVTPLEAILRAKPDLAITHEPGHMLVTDVPQQSILGGWCGER